MIQRSKKHFHTFDALRFFAFLKVFLLHVPIVAFPFFTFLRNGGGIGVIFFFVLSGFLITYILLVEKQSAGAINLRYFFFRRIVRIWPLYYLMAGFAFLTPWILSFFPLTHSNEGYQPNWLLSLTFLENYKMIFTRSHPNVSPLGVTWSLCIEEHFYLVWGLLLYYIKTEKIPVLIIACFVISAISRFLFMQHDLPTIDLFTNIDYFAWGAIPAYLLVCRKKLFDQKLAAIPVGIKLVILGLILFYILISANISYQFQPYVEPFISGLSFCFVISSILPQQNAVMIKDSNLFSRLGLYTYGMYLYHTILINLFIQLFRKFGFSLSVPGYAIIFISLTLSGTILVSLLSFFLFERYFLRLKKFYRKEKVISFNQQPQ